MCRGGQTPGVGWLNVVLTWLVFELAGRRRPALFELGTHRRQSNLRKVGTKTRHEGA